MRSRAWPLSVVRICARWASVSCQPTSLACPGIPKEFADVLTAPALQYMVDVYRRTLLVDRKIKLQSLLEHRKSALSDCRSVCQVRVVLPSEAPSSESNSAAHHRAEKVCDRQRGSILLPDRFGSFCSSAQLQDVKLEDGTVALGYRQDTRAIRQDREWKVRSWQSL